MNNGGGTPMKTRIEREVLKFGKEKGLIKFFITDNFIRSINISLPKGVSFKDIELVKEKPRKEKQT